MTKIIQKKLQNGVRVVFAPSEHSQTATALVLVGTGAAYEKPEQSGLSHFLEHMCFKGTKRWPTAKAISEEFENLGAVTNAFTTYDYTGYYAKGNPAHLGTFIEVLADIYQNAVFLSEDIEKEKGVIIEEINMYEDDMPHVAEQALMTLIYGDQPMGRSILGTKETVKNLSQKDLIEYVKNKYSAEKTVLVISGNFDPTKVLIDIKKNFGNLTSKKIYKKSKTTLKQKGMQSVVKHKATDQGHVVIGFPSVTFEHALWAPTMLLATVLGRGMSSRLFITLREELGAAYYVRSSTEDFNDHALFTIAAGIDRTRLDIVIKAIVNELETLKKEEVSLKELSKVKELTTSMIRMSLESTDEIALFYGTQLVQERAVLDPEKILKRLVAVKALDIKKAAQKIFDMKKCSISLVGPFSPETLSEMLLKLGF